MLLIPTSAALAAPPFDTIVGEDETINNDVIVLDGDVEIAAGATVNGNVIAFNGDANVAGTISGDLVLFNGNLSAAGTAEIRGDCVLLNGEFTHEDEVSFSCTDVESVPSFIPALTNLPSQLELPRRPDIKVNVPSTANSFFFNLADAAVRALVLGFLAFVVASMLPGNLTQIQDAVKEKPLASGSVGLLTAVAVPSLVALLIPVSILLTLVCIGLLGFPLMAVLLLGLVAGALLGWIAVGNMLGQRLAEPLKLKNRTAPVTAALGTALLTFFIGLMGFGEGVVIFLVSCIGLGATALTKFGTTPYPSGATAVNRQKTIEVLQTLPVEDPADLKNSDG